MMSVQLRAFVRKYLALLLCLFLMGSWSQTRAQQVVISQLYGGGTGATYQNDYVELFNRGNAPVVVSGWSLQYASATGTGNFGANTVVNLTGTIAPGRYYLVQLAAGTTGSPLPVTADLANTGLNLSGTAGKVVLVNTTAGLPCNGGSTPCSGTALSSIVDLVGYGTANYFETTVAPAPSATNAIFRAQNGCQDTNNNGSDFVAAAANPRNSASPLNTCGTVSNGLTATPTALSGFTTPQGTPSAAQAYTLTAQSLTATVGITAPVGVEVSQDNIAFSPTLTLPQTTTAAVVFTRLMGTTTGAVTGTITNVSGSLTANVSISGTVTSTVISGTGTTLTTLCTPYTQDFNALASTGTTNTALPGGWFLAESGTNANGQYVADNGNSNSGNVYSYGATGSPDRSFGTLRSSSLVPIIGAVFVNNTGATLTSLDISYVGKQWRLGTDGREDRLDFQYSTTASSLTASSGWTDVDQLDFRSPTTSVAGPKDGNDQDNQTAINYTLTGLSVANGATVWLRFVDVDASGADDGLAIDDFALTPGASGACSGLSVTPNPVSLAYVVGSGPASQTLTVTGTNLNPASGLVTVTSSNTAIQLSVNGSVFGPTVTLPYTSSALSTTLGIQLMSGLVVGTYPASVSLVGGGVSINLAVTGAVNTSATSGTATYIHSIQGSGTTFALGGAQTIEGVVVRAFKGATLLNGFYVQEEDADADANPATSEGIFCFDPGGLFTGNTGDKVRVTGTVAEFTSTQDGVSSSETQLTTLTSVVNLGTSPLPAITTVTFPVANVSDLERYEGMLVEARAATGNLTVSEHFNLARYGQVTLSATDASNQPGTDARIDQFTQFNAPSVSGYTAYVAAVAKRRIILDDASSVQNTPTTIHARGGNPLSASNTLRGGDNVTSITAVMSQRFDGYRLQTNVGVAFTAANPRPANVPSTGGSLKVAAANVLNFFNGPTFPTSRGADNATELTRQRAKIVANLVGTQADIIALMEIENDGYGANSAIQDLVNALNTATSPGAYTFLNAGPISSDEITVAMVYKPGVVAPVGAAAVLPNAYGTGSYDVVGRKPLLQTFRQLSNNEVLTVVGNHWKSKGSSSGGPGDADAGDGQALSNGIRTRQAQDLLQWLATNPTGTTDPDYLILGDLNAYAKEQPLTTLITGGYVPLIGDASYSFAFRGEWGSLDHALSTTSLAGQVTGAAKWYINADEPRALDYNTEFKTAAQINSLYAPDQYRSADHDPLVVGLNLGAACTTMQSVKTGPWNDPTTWSCGRVPVITDEVTISASHIVTIPPSYTAQALRLRDWGQLVYGAGSVLQVGN
jgi:uncharacterized protein